MILFVATAITNVNFASAQNYNPDGILAFDMSADGRLLVTGHIDFSVRVFDTVNQQMLFEIAGPSFAEGIDDLVTYVLRDIAITPDGSKVLISYGGLDFWGLLRIIDVSTGTISQDIEAGSDAYDIAWKPDGSQIAAKFTTGSFTSPHLYLGIWDATNGSLIQQIDLNELGSVSSVGLVWSPDGSQLALDVVDIIIWDAITWQPTITIPARVGRLSWRYDGSQIAGVTGDGTIYVFDTISGQQLHEFSGNWQRPVLLDIDWSPDGQYIAVGSEGPQIRIWNNTTGAEEQPISLSTGVDQLLWAPNGDILTAAGSLTSVQVAQTLISQPTATPGATNTETAIPTFTIAPTNTETATFTPTSTSTVTATFTSTPTLTETATLTPTSTSTVTPTATETPTATSTSTPQPSSLISNIVAANGKTYTRDTVAAGNTLYIDRTYTFVTVPAELAGQDYIRTANNDKQLTTTDFLTFSLSQTAAVYVMYDTRYPIPPWLRGWTDTGQTVVATEQNNTELSRRLYRRDYPAGTVVLGANQSVNTSVMYNVIAAPITENVVYRMDVGSTTGYTSAAGVVWGADNYFTGGSLSNLPNPIINTADDALYTFQRTTTSDTAGFSYALPLTNGTYTVRLHFAETYWVGGTNRGIPGVNKRVFNVQLEGTTVLTNYDITAQVGALAADIRTFTVMVTDGTLNINFPAASVNRPTLAALEVIGQ